MQLELPLIDEQVPEQLLSQELSQSALQLKLPGFSEQVPMQLLSQLPEQLGSVAVQPPEQLASSCALHATWRFGGEHWTSHDALASTVQLALPSTTAPPQSSKMFPAHAARAELAANVSVAPATRARSEDQRNIRDLLRLICIPDETGGGELSFNDGTAPHRSM